MGKKEKEKKEKPLDRMTAKELRETALKIPEITGVHGMNKAELLVAMKKARGIVDEAAKKSDVSVREIKKKIRDLKALKAQGRYRHLRVSSRVPRTRLNPLFAVNYIDRQLRKDLDEHVRETCVFRQERQPCVGPVCGVRGV